MVEMIESERAKKEESVSQEIREKCERNERQECLEVIISETETDEYVASCSG
jgi:hypothetical protein